MSSRFAAIGGALLLKTSRALACPLCNSDRAAAVRGGIFYDGHLVSNLLITVSPFVLLAPIVARIYFRWPPESVQPEKKEAQ